MKMIFSVFMAKMVINTMIMISKIFQPLKKILNPMEKHLAIISKTLAKILDSITNSI